MITRKITLIGGGSYSWTDGLYITFLRNPFFGRETELCLYDVNEEALNNLYNYLQLYAERNPEQTVTVTKTTNEDEALYGADYVLVAISHGGFNAELEDHYIARRHGFYNVKGSESGIAGASRTVRHVPEFVRIGLKMQKLCPKAWLMNVTNPLTSLTRCVQKYADRNAIGFCHGIKNHLEILEPYFGCNNTRETGLFNDISFSVAGVDHCSFLTDVKYKGQDALQIMRDKGMIEAAWKGDSITIDDYFAGRENQRIRFIVWDMLGVMPGLSDEHCAEFYYQTTGTQVNRDTFGMHYDRIKDRTAAVNRLKSNILDNLNAGKTPMDTIADEIIHRAIEALDGGREYYDVMNYRNLGQVRELPNDIVVETFNTIDATGVHPAIANPLPKSALSVAYATAMREEMFMEAAMEQDEAKLTAALCNDPLVQDFTRVREVAHEVMEYNRQFLNPEIAKLL